MSKFKIAVALFIVPDFAKVDAGEAKPPFIDHSKLDYKRLADALKSIFIYGKLTDIRVANDTIDMITVGSANDKGDFKKLRFGEAGAALLNCDQNSLHGDVIDVREAWANMHEPFAGKWTAAPPPMALIFVVEANSFDDAFFWLDQSREALGMNTSGIYKIQQIANAFKGEPPHIKQDAPESVAKKLITELTLVFGAEFHPEIMIDWCCLSGKPGCDAMFLPMFNREVAEGKRIL